LAGGALSCITQIYLASFYLGHGTYALFAPMLIFSMIASIITAFFSQYIKIPQNAPLLKKDDSVSSAPATSSPDTGPSVFKTIILILSVLISSFFIFMETHIYFLLLCMIICFAAEIVSGRKLLILPHIFMWLFIIISSLFVPQGKVIYSIGKFAVTQDALLNAILKASKLSSVMALSQCCTNISLKKLSILSLTFSYFNGLIDILKSTEGNIFKKLAIALQSTELQDNFHDSKKIKIALPVLIALLNVLFFVYNFYGVELV